MTVTLRIVSESDRGFLLDLYADSRAAELAPVPWTDAQKRAFLEMQFAAQSTSYAENHPGATHEIICADGNAVGRLYLSRQPGVFHILDILIATASRNKGIGSQILAGILAEADRAGEPITIYVETFNPSLGLFKRLGFQPISENGFLLLLQRPASASGRESNSSAEAGPPDD